MSLHHPPLVVGNEGFPANPVPVDSTIGMLTVDTAPEERDGLLVQYCHCECSRRECGGSAHVDVRFLNDPALAELDRCPLTGPAFFPPFETVMEAVRALGISDTKKYREAYVLGKLPPRSPRQPEEYPEWTSWADFTGNSGYHSDKELLDGLLALDLDSLGLLPRPDRRRFLLASRYWISVKEKAAELGIEEKDIPDRLAEIVAVLGGTDDPFALMSDESNGEGTLGGGRSSSGSRSKVPAQLTLEEEGHALINSVTLWLPDPKELQREIINGFFAHVWEILDREDVLYQQGIEAVEQYVLTPLRNVKPDLVVEFLRQYEGAKKHKINGRNWMQAYSVWYAHENRRFINWSSAGLGKTRTIPAIVKEFDIHLTVLFSPKKITNEDNPQLAGEMMAEDPEAVLYFSDHGVPATLEPGRHSYFIVNSEKLQLGAKTIAMIDALMVHRPGLVVFDEGHLLVSSNLVEDKGEDAKDAKFKPRMEGLRYLLASLAEDTRITVLTGTPVRVDAREGQALFELIGEDVGEFSSEMSELNALRLRGRLQEFGFQFRNWKLPVLKRYIAPFVVPKEVAARLSVPGLSILDKEKVRVEYALKTAYSLKGRPVINTERVEFAAHEATSIEDVNALKEEMGLDLSSLSAKRFPVVRLNYEPLEEATHPIFFSYFVDGPADTIAAFLDERGIKYRRCTGDSDEAELGEYLTKKDSSLIASGAWSTGIDGSQRIANALCSLALPWHDSGHRQMVARIQRQGAMTPDGKPTTVIHEIIPVALNLEYDVRRLNRVFSRRSFSEVLAMGEVDGQDDSAELQEAVAAFAGAA